MSVFNTLNFTEVQRIRKFVRQEHLKTFGVELPQVKVDQFIEAYWGEYMEEQLKNVVDSGKLE